MLQELTSGGLLASSGDGHCQSRFKGPPNSRNLHRERGKHLIWCFLMFYIHEKRNHYYELCRLGTLTAVSESCSWLLLVGEGGYSACGDGRVHKAKQKKTIFVV